MQAERLDTGLAQTIVAMVTSNMARSGHPSRVTVRVARGEGGTSGLLTDSVIMTDNLATIHITEIDRMLGRLDDLNELDAALRRTFDLSD